MTDLTIRAEQAVLGALLTGGAKNGELGGIQAEDFAQMRHRAIFAALTDAVPQPSGLLGKLRMWLTGLPLRPQVRDFRQYLTELPGTCPDPGHLSSYAKMVAEASEQRRQTASAEQDAPDLGRIAGAAAYLASQAEKTAAGRQWLPRGSRASTGTALARDTAIAARAVQQHPVRPVARPAPSPSRQVMRAENLEELVLADLLQQPADGKEVVGWLPVEVFTSEARRVIYGDIRHRLQEGEPVDPLIIAWDLNRAHDLQRPDNEPGGKPDRALDPGYVLRIAALDAAPGTAALLGRALLADQVCTRRLGADWPRSLQVTQRAPGTAATPGPAARPEPRSGPSPDMPRQPAPAGRQREPAVVDPPPAIPEPAGPVQRM